MATYMAQIHMVLAIYTDFFHIFMENFVVHMT